MENNKKIKPNSYYSIQYWMINELGLKGLELSIYAIIYGFSRDHCGAFTGSRSYLADFTNSTKAGVDKALKSFSAFVPAWHSPVCHLIHEKSSEQSLL